MWTDVGCAASTIGPTRARDRSRAIGQSSEVRAGLSNLGRFGGHVALELGYRAVDDGPELLGRDDAPEWTSAHDARLGRLLDDAAYFGASPESRKARDLARDPHAVVHLEVVILEDEVDVAR
jgi:hypothetical protein